MSGELYVQQSNENRLPDMYIDRGKQPWPEVGGQKKVEEVRSKL